MTKVIYQLTGIPTPGPGDLVGHIEAALIGARDLVKELTSVRAERDQVRLHNVALVGSVTDLVELITADPAAERLSQHTRQAISDAQTIVDPDAMDRLAGQFRTMDQALRRIVVAGDSLAQSIARRALEEISQV